jgi:hypothetical protein
MRSILERKQPSKRKTVRNGLQVKRLKARLTQQAEIIKTVCHYLKMSVEGPLPSRCVNCGCTRFYKNGFFKIGIANLLGECFHNSERKVPVQKFVCVNCDKSARLEGPAALFHWAVSNSGLEMGNSGRGRKKGGRKKDRTRPEIMIRAMLK